MITTNEAIKIFGKPNQQGSYLTTIQLPFPMRLAWDKKTSVTKMRVHKKAAQDFTNVFNELFFYYCNIHYPLSIVRYLSPRNYKKCLKINHLVW